MGRLVVISVIAASLSGCALATEPGVDGDPPQVLGIDSQAVSVGEPLEIVGGNFLKGLAGHTEIRFKGVYEADSGSTHNVDFRIRPHWEDGNKLVWAQVGPFRVPFHPEGNETGVFHGSLTAINVTRDTEHQASQEFESEPLDIELEIEPSIILTEFQPVIADCTAPSRVILGGYYYRVGVEAIGFEPVNFSYLVGQPGSDAPRIYRHKALGRQDTFGDDGQIWFNPVPGDRPFYVGTLAVTSLGTDGKQQALALNFGVHNPIEHVSLNRVKVAEIESATPVSGCHGGGETNGRTVTWMETETDTRERTTGVTWNESWMEQQENMQGGSTTTTNSISFDVNQSQTSGWEMGWARTQGSGPGGLGEYGGNFGIDKIVQIGVEGKFIDRTEVSRSFYGSNTKGYTVGRDYTTSDTESWAFTRTRGHTVETGGMDFWTVSSSQSTSTSYEGFILPGEYGVFYRQTTRLALPGVIVAYNLCGKPEVVAETNLFDYTWSVDLAQGGECPPLPKSSLPEAECFVAPCSTPE